jgi:hypothetical protein
VAGACVEGGAVGQEHSAILYPVAY